VTDALDVPPPDLRIYPLLAAAGLSDAVFNPRQHRSCELVERYVDALATDVVRALGSAPPVDAARPLDALLRAAALPAAFDTRARWLLDRLVGAGLVACDAAGYRGTGAPAPPRDALRAAILDADASYAAAVELLDEAAAAYPRVARGETTGEAALLRRLALWVRYFANTNGYYALGNHVAAVAAAARLPSPPATILEVGGGLGSAAEALLARVPPGRIARYRFTEPVAFFRRRAERTLATAHPTLALETGELDLNAPWAAQGVAPGSIDLVWGVNVFHLARRLDDVLAEARAALAPGGWLVAGEGLRPRPDARVGAEFPFLLLDSFVDVELDPAARPTPGFLAAPHWLAALARAGFASGVVVPDPTRLGALYPGFFAGAVCGRRPVDDAETTERPIR